RCSPQRTSLLCQRNQALAEARADLVAILDADDVCEPDRIEKQLGYLRAHPEVTVLGSHIRVIDGAGRTRGYRLFPLDHEGVVRTLPLCNPVCQSSVLMRKEAVLAAGGYRYGAYVGVEDYELWFRLARSGARFATYP